MLEVASAARTWGLVTDPRVWLVIVAGSLFLLGRAGLLRPSWLDLLKPWRVHSRPSGSVPQRAGAPNPLRDPFYIFLLVISVTAVTAWIIMRMTVTANRT